VERPARSSHFQRIRASGSVVPVPQGNLAARVAMSPDGKPARLEIHPAPQNPETAIRMETARAGQGRATSASASAAVLRSQTQTPRSWRCAKAQPSENPIGLKRPDPNADADDPPERIGPPNFATLPPGAKPELIFTSRRVYSMNINMPNLSSATGSWIIHFSELHLGGSAAHRLGEVNAPVALRKVDPKYPQTLVQDHVEVK